MVYVPAVLEGEGSLKIESIDPAGPATISFDITAAYVMNNEPSRLYLLLLYYDIRYETIILFCNSSDIIVCHLK